MWMFPRACAVCFTRENLIDCEGCLCVSYCSTEHQTVHKNIHGSVCPDLKLCLEYDRFHWKKHEIEIELKDIDDDINQLPNSIQDCMKMILYNSKFSNELERIYVTDMFASMLTLIYGLEKCEIIQNRHLKTDNIVVHIVGADISEWSIDWNLNFQFLHKWIKNLINIKVILIGPNCEWDPSIKLEQNNIKFECVKDFYHTATNIDEPDLIVSFNSGLHEFESDDEQDTWKKSLEKLINDKAPLVITSYTKQELEEDLKRLELCSMKTLIDIERNPFSNLRPLRDWDSELCTPFYVNGYLAIVAGKEYQ